MVQEKESLKQANEFVIERVFNASRQLVWKAFGEAEIETFRNGFESMDQGFSVTFDQLDEYLARL
jgi:hypothetical protein